MNGEVMSRPIIRLMNKLRNAMFTIYELNKEKNRFTNDQICTCVLTGCHRLIFSKYLNLY